MKNTTTTGNDASPIHEMQVAAAMLSPAHRETVFGTMGTFGADLFASEAARFVWQAIAVDGLTDPVSIMERPNPPDNFDRFLIQALDILNQWEVAGKTRADLEVTVHYLAGLARRRLMSGALATGATPEQMAELIAGLPTTENVDVEPFADRLKARFQALIDGIGIPQKHVLKTTWTAINQIIQGGFRDGELVVIAARPGMGKTALALCLAIALSFQRGVDFYSMEMGAGEVLDRCLSILCDIPNHHILQPTEALKRWQAAVDMFDASMDLRLEDRGSLTLSEMLQRSKGRIPVIDYLQLVPGMTRSDAFENRQLQVTAMSKACKEWARANKAPVFILSQLNRDVEKRRDKRPLPSDLRESGAVEQDADKILFVYRDCVYNGEDSDRQRPHEAEIIVAKQRNGPTGTINLTFQPQFGRFVEGFNQ